jgi:hypothetical protein
MAWMWSDSFDFYASTSDLVANTWDSNSGNSISSTTRFSQGQALQVNGGGAIAKNNLSSEGTIWINLALYWTTAGFTGTNANGFFITLRDTVSNNQVTIHFAGDGNVYVRTGGTAGAIVGTWTAPWTVNAWHHFQIKVIIHNTAGEVHIRKNGDPSDSFSVTGINTRGGSTNNTANSVSITGANFAVIMDDFLMFSSSGAAPNDWVGDVRSVQLMPTANTAQKDFTPITTTREIGATINTLARSAGVEYWYSDTPTENGTITSLAISLNAAVTGHMKMGVYSSDSGGNPNALLGTSNEVTNPASGSNTFTFSSPVAITAGTKYWYAVHSDVAFTFKTSNSSPAAFSLVRAYASGLIDPATGLTGAGALQADIVVSVLRANFDLVRETTEDGDTTYVFDSTAGHYDLYDLQDLAVTPSSIVGVCARQFARKTDAGTRSGTTTVKSGATTQDQATFAQSTSYQYLNSFMATDPNTSTAWTAAAVNALQVGPKVVS